MEMSARAFNRPLLYEGSEEQRAFVTLCHFMMDCMEDKVMDVRFSFCLLALDEATLRQIECSWVHKLPRHKDKLPNWGEGVEGKIVRMFHLRMLDGCP